MPGSEEGVELRDGGVRFFRMGEGPPLILLHGLGEAAIVWFGNLVSLSKSHTVYAVDLPGHGKSYKPSWDSPLDEGVQFLVDFMDVLDIPSASILGNSMGGLLALATTLKHPNRVDHLVLESSAGLGRDIACFLRLMTLPIIGEVLAEPKRFMIRHLLHLILYDKSLCTEELIEELYQARSLSGNKQSMLFMLRSGVSFRGVTPNVVLINQLDLVEIPVLLVWGRNDPIFPMSHAEQAVEVFPNAQLKIFDNCGHWPHLEALNEFNRTVLNFCVAH